MTQAASRIFANVSSSNSLSFIFQAVLVFASCNSLLVFKGCFAFPTSTFQIDQAYICYSYCYTNTLQTKCSTDECCHDKWCFVQMGTYLVTTWHAKSKQHFETFVKINSRQYSKVITHTITSQIAGVYIVYSTVCSGTDQIKHQSSASRSRAFLREIHWWYLSRNRQHDGILSIGYLSLSVKDQRTPSKLTGWDTVRWANHCTW